ncbi:hypothetical protein H477_2553 [[Clostridium] sordellii ATCC 9714]|nr:hypothetical protein H477_2553 [[Clostridium] sordellii ATCC 9714] [Paeniclostridium sordellii ATCC 9714]
MSNIFFPIVIFDGDYFIKNGKFDFDEGNLNYQLKKYKNLKLIMFYMFLMIKI